MAPPLGVPKLIFGYIHDKAGDRANCCIGACACAWLVLTLLIVRLPLETQCQASLTTLLRVPYKVVHLSFFYAATQGESAIYHQQSGQDA